MRPLEETSVGTVGEPKGSAPRTVVWARLADGAKSSRCKNILIQLICIGMYRINIGGHVQVLIRLPTSLPGGNREAPGYRRKTVRDQNASSSGGSWSSQSGWALRKPTRDSRRTTARTMTSLRSLFASKRVLIATKGWLEFQPCSLSAAKLVSVSIRVHLAASSSLMLFRRSLCLRVLHCGAKRESTCPKVSQV